MASDAEIAEAAKAMFVRICTNADPEETWRETIAMPQHAPLVTFYQEHARAALEAAERVRGIAAADRRPESAAHAKGRAAHARGVTIGMCPIKNRWSRAYTDWRSGWLAAALTAGTTAANAEATKPENKVRTARQNHVRIARKKS